MKIKIKRLTANKVNTDRSKKNIKRNYKNEIN